VPLLKNSQDLDLNTEECLVMPKLLQTIQSSPHHKLPELQFQPSQDLVHHIMVATEKMLNHKLLLKSVDYCENILIFKLLFNI